MYITEATSIAKPNSKI